MSQRVLLLFGGGLDSRLARAALEADGFDVQAVHFDTGFVHDARRSAIAREPVEVVDVTHEYLERVVLAPTGERGAGLNACRDCRRYLLERADALARERGIERLATGEVVGQRALDQSVRALARAELDAGVQGRVERPLSASPHGLRGQSRRAQRDWARRIGLDPGPSPSGGCCLLADRRFARRLRDLIEHREPSSIARRDLERLRLGRHYRLDWEAKLVVGRDEAECRGLASDPGADWLCRAVGLPGAVGLLDAEPAGERGALAASIVAYHGSGRSVPRVEVEIERGPEVRRFAVAPAGADEVRALRL